MSVKYSAEARLRDALLNAGVLDPEPLIDGFREDARTGALIRGAEIGWDAAVSAMQFEDGTKPDLVSVVNPYRQKENTK